jgi:hypothetical protein
MKKVIACLALAATAAVGLLAGARGNQAAPAAAADTEVAKNPNLLVWPSAKVAELTVHGIKLGDPIEPIAKDPAYRREDIPQRPNDIVYVGPDAIYYAFNGRVYRITIREELAKLLPPYDAVRLQMALGKADDAAESVAGVEARLNFYARHAQYTVHAYPRLSVVVAVDLYAP